DERDRPLLESLPPERARDESSMRVVLGSIHAEDGRAHHQSHGLAVHLRGERLRLSEHQVDVRVPVYPVAALPVEHDEVDRPLAPALRVVGIRVADVADRGVVEEIEIEVVGDAHATWNTTGTAVGERNAKPTMYGSGAAGSRRRSGRRSRSVFNATAASIRA